MLDGAGFDLWAEGYDASVGLSDEAGSYPFAGYGAILNAIYGRVLGASGRVVLDLGFGTAALTAKLYERGCAVYGQDFSPRMLELARAKMPNAALYQGDFANGLTAPLTRLKYDAIIATYSLHHLTDAQKVSLLNQLLPLLNETGCIYIGDVTFETRAELLKCRAASGAEWDEDEIYFVYDELRRHFPKMQFEPMSSCAGLLTLRR